MGKALALALSLAVPAAAVHAPLVHAHPDSETTDHHDARTIHTHWAGHAHSSHPTGTPVLRADDHDRAVFLNAFVAVNVAIGAAPGVVHEGFELRVPGERAAHRSVAVAHGHDPPVRCALPSRAPPRLPVLI